MAIRVFEFENTRSTLTTYPWEVSESRYKAVLVSPSYIYDQANNQYADVVNYQLGNVADIAAGDRTITIESGGNNTIVRSGKIGFSDHTEDYTALGLMVFLSKSVSLNNDDELVFWVSFGENLSFKPTDSIDGSSGLYYFTSELF